MSEPGDPISPHEPPPLQAPSAGEPTPARDELAELPEPVASPTPPPPRRSARRWLLILVVGLLVGALDQASKHWAQETLRARHGGRLELVEGRVALSYVQNPGAAWGLLSGQSAAFRLPFFLAVSVLALAFVFYLYARLEPGQRLAMFALALVAGGALGNLIDRLRFNYVVDFIECTITSTFKWPTFNVADVAISVGVALLFVEMIIGSVAERRRRRAARAALDACPDDEPAAAHAAPAALDSCPDDEPGATP